MTVDVEIWKRARVLFESALELEASGRSAFLARECAGDADLLATVERLLARDHSAGASSTRDIAAGVLDLVTEPEEGRRVGPYRLLRELGSGGMGTVYLAERADGEFDHEVAVKILHFGVDRERFQVERQVLARLTHPHIARLLDGGSLPDGRPFVVMEHVEGESLTRACDAGRLPVRERLARIVELARAVEHAHRSLVVHRDLKPGNVLVDGEGRVKLLDFGIAKLLDDSRLPATETAPELRRMTVGYASPEQLRGLPIGTPSDVYSLGVILYELLCGARPFESLEDRPQALIEALRNRLPPLPSRRLTAIGDVEERRRTAAACGTTPERLARALRGDLDKITLQALAFDPGGRYPSASSLADDLERHLSGRPVAARGTGLWYRTGKLVGRHRFASAAALLVLALGGYQQARILEQRDAAARERDTARATQDFLVDLFAVSDPSEALGKRVTAREILDRGAERLADELRDQPRVRAAMMATIGEVYFNLGLYRSAEPLLERSLESRRRTEGDHSVDVAEGLNLLATLRYYQGLYTEAEPLAAEALAVRRALLGEGDVLVAESMDLLAILLMLRGELDAAEPLLRDALAVRRARLGRHRAVADNLNNLAGLVKRRGDFEGARKLYEESLAILRSLQAEPHPALANGLNNLGALLLEQEEPKAAAEVLREALAMRRSLLGDLHPDVAVTLTNLGSALTTLDAEEAAATLERALEIRLRVLGDAHPEVAATLYNLATAQEWLPDSRAAAESYRRALEIWERSLGGDHWLTAVARTGLAGALIRSGEDAAAKELLARALAVLEPTLGPSHRRIAVARRFEGVILRREMRFAEAEERLEGSWLMARELSLRDDARRARDELVRLYRAWGKPERAAEVQAIDDEEPAP